MNAIDFLVDARTQMEARAALRDTPEGERAVSRTVRMFNTLTGHQLSEADGWKFLLLLKMVRAENGNFHADDYTDMSAYSALLGECEAVDHERDSTSLPST